MPPSSHDPRLLFAVSMLVLAALAPGAGCAADESTNPLTTSATTTSVITGVGGSGGATTTSSTTSLGGSGGTTTTSSTTTSSSTTTTTTSSSTSTSSSTTTGDSWPACHSCLQTHCATEIAACDAGCTGIQACLDAVCGNLSTIGAADEGACQVYCQTQHFASKNKHLDMVNCAQMASPCMPPCSFAGYDWDKCVEAATKGACMALIDDCTNDMQCTDYLGCALTCTTTPECKACSATPEGAAGRAKFEAYWQCVESDCLAEAWLPHF